MKKSNVILNILAVIVLLALLYFLYGKFICDHRDKNDNGKCDICGQYVKSESDDPDDPDEPSHPADPSVPDAPSDPSDPIEPAEPEEPVHTHKFNVMLATEEYFASAADCVYGEKYYFSCSCGEIGEETFINGNSLGHSYENGECTRCFTLKASEGLKFRSLGDGFAAVVSIGSCTDKALVIPTNTPDGEVVIAIDESAFKGCTKLTSVVIPTNVTKIGYAAFSGCTSLQSITIPFVGEQRSNTTETYQYPFGYIFGMDPFVGGTMTDQYNLDTRLTVNNMTSVKYCIPNTLKTVKITDDSIKYGAFLNCANITEAVIGETATIIDTSAFSGCAKLVSVSIGCNVESIGASAFFGCYSLVSVTLHEGVTTIGEKAFYYCNSLESINIPASVTLIGVGAFYKCDRLVSVEFAYTIGWFVASRPAALSGTSVSTTSPAGNAENLRSTYTNYHWKRNA